jgi:Electron transfer DM13
MSALIKTIKTTTTTTTTNRKTNRTYGTIVLALGFLTIFMLGTFSIIQSQTIEAQEQQQQQKPMSTLSGQFIGAGDGIHNAEGVAKEISLEDGRKFIRFENFKVTNGPNLFVYLATDKSASDFVNIGQLKANNGNQNYEVPDGTDLTKYDTVLVWCKAFSVLFGSAELTAAT